MVRLYVRDNLTGEVHEYGTNIHDSLIVNNDGSLHYFNAQDYTGTEFQDEGYTFVYKNGQDPRESKMVKKYKEEPVLDIGGTYNPILNIEVVQNELSWLDKAIRDFTPSRAEKLFN